MAKTPKNAKMYVHFAPNPQMLPGLKTSVSEKKEVSLMGVMQKLNANAFVI